MRLVYGLFSLVNAGLVVYWWWFALTSPVARTGLIEIAGMSFLAANAILLGMAAPSSSKPWRVKRMLGLWLDAKENDLKKRAGTDGR